MFIIPSIENYVNVSFLFKTQLRSLQYQYFHIEILSLFYLLWNSLKPFLIKLKNRSPFINASSQQYLKSKQFLIGVKISVFS